MSTTNSPLSKEEKPVLKTASPTHQPGQSMAAPGALPTIQRDMDVSRMQPSQVLSLQRAIGNRAVQQLVSSSRNAPVIQTKLQVGPVGDRYEQEADRVAKEVVRMPAASSPTAQRETDTETVQRMGEEEDEEELEG